MKVAIIGVGGVGRTLAQLLRAETAIDSLLLIDKEKNRVRFFTKMMGRGKGDAAALHFNAPSGLPRVLRGCAVVVHTAAAAFNLAVTDGVVLAGNVPFGHALAPLRVVRRRPSRTGAAERLGRLRVPAPRRRPTHVPRQSRGGEDPSPVPRQAGPAGRFQTSVPSRVNPSRVVFENPGAPGRGPENLDRLGAGSFPSSVSPSAAGTVGPRASGRWREGAERGSRGNGRRHAQGRASRHRDGPPRGGEAGRNHGRDLSDSGRRSDRDAPYRRGGLPRSRGLSPRSPRSRPRPERMGRQEPADRALFAYRADPDVKSGGSASDGSPRRTRCSTANPISRQGARYVRLCGRTSRPTQYEMSGRYQMYSRVGTPKRVHSQNCGAIETAVASDRIARRFLPFRKRRANSGATSLFSSMLST